MRNQNNLESQNLQIDDLNEYRVTKSSASCLISDITGIIYGG
jgi:hypothetical protein